MLIDDVTCGCVMWWTHGRRHFIKEDKALFKFAFIRMLLISLAEISEFGSADSKAVMVGTGGRGGAGEQLSDLSCGLFNWIQYGV